MNFKKIFKLPNYYIGIRISFKKRERTKSIGITNKIGRHYVLFLDYDINDYKLIVEEIESLQKDYKLGNAYVFITKKGFHIIIPDLLTYQEHKKIIESTSVEYAYKKVPQQNNKKVWVLRITPKKNNNNIEPYMIIKSKYNKRKKSKPHTNYLIKKGFKIKNNNNFCYNNKKLIYAIYEA